MSIISDFKKKNPVYKDVRDDELATALYDKFPIYQKEDKVDFVRKVVGINVAVDVPPPDESIKAQVGNIVDPVEKAEDHRLDELPLGIKDTPHAQALEGLGNAFKVWEAALTVGYRKLLGLEVPDEVSEAITDPSESETPGELATKLFGTERFIKEATLEKTPEAKGGPLEILPDTMFGMPTAEVPREALAEMADLVGLTLNPKQIILLNPIFKLGLETIGELGGKEAIQWVKGILSKFKNRNPKGATGEKVVEEVRNIVIEDTGIAEEAIETETNKAMKALQTEIETIGKDAKLLPNRITEEAGGTGEAFRPTLAETKELPGPVAETPTVTPEPVQLFSEDMIQEEARLIREEISQAVHGENVVIRDDDGVIVESITGGSKSTFPPYYTDLTKKGKYQSTSSKETVLNSLKTIESGSKKTNKTIEKVRDLIDERLKREQGRFEPGTGQHAPDRVNHVQFEEEFAKTTEGQEQKNFDDIADFFDSQTEGVHATGGGFADTDIAKNPPFIEMPELVEIAKNLTGKYPKVKRNLLRGKRALGVMRHDNQEAEIALLAEMFQDPGLAAKVLAHEIGHVVDWLPDKAMSKSVLGKIASLKGYMKSYLEDFPGAPGPLTAAEKAKLKRLSQKMAKQGQQSGPEISPEDVLAIWRDVKSFEKNRPLNDYVASLTRAQKSEIMKAAIKGKLPDWVDFGQVYKFSAPDAKKIYQKLLEEEVAKRNLIQKDVIIEELKNFTQRWKPFQEGLDPSYTKYRYSANELYADAVSGLLSNPELLKDISPTFYRGFFNYLERKPQFKDIYLQIVERAKRGKIEVLRERDKNLEDMFNRDESKRRKLAEPDPVDVLGVLKKELIDNNAPRITKYKEAVKKGIELDATKNPIYWAEEYPYTHAAYFEYIREVENTVRIPLRKARVSDNDFAKFLLLRRAMTDRSDLANPLGQIGAAPGEQIAFMKARLGPERFQAIEDAAEAFTASRKKNVLSILNEAEMYNDKLMGAIEANMDTYVKFQVSKFLEKNFGKESAGRLFKQAGTLEDVSNPLTATLIQDAGLMRAAAIKMERKTFIDMMKEIFPDEIQLANRKWNGLYHEPQTPDSAKQGLVTYLHKGKVQGYYLPKEIADNFLKESLEAGKIVRALGFVTAPFKEIFVGKNPFWMTWNIQRDVRAMSKNLPGGSIPKTMWYITKSMPDAFQDVFRNVSTADVSEMYRQKMLVVGRYYAALDAGPEEALDKIMKSYGLNADLYEKKVINPFVKFWELLDKPGKFSERVVKIAGFKQLKNTPVDKFPSVKGLRKLTKAGQKEGEVRQSIGVDLDKEIGHIVRTQAGSPDFLRKGHLSPLYNNIWLFSNAGKEGWRASIEAARENPLSYTWKTVKYDLMPKILMYGGATGMMGAKIKRLYDNIPDRDLANYICIPLGLTASGKTAYIVMPHDFMGQAIAGTFWQAMTATKIEDVRETYNFIAGGTPYTSLNPVVSTAINTSRYISGINPYDSWSGRNIIPESIFRAGGGRSHLEYAKHLWNTLGGGVIYRFKHDDIDKVQTEFEELYGIPLVGTGLRRFIRVSDYGVREDLKKAKQEIKVKNANDLLDAKDIKYKIINNVELTDEDLLILANKPSVVSDKEILKSMAGKYGQTALEEFLNANTNEEANAVLRKWEEINDPFPAPQFNMNKSAQRKIEDSTRLNDPQFNRETLEKGGRR